MAAKEPGRGDRGSARGGAGARGGRTVRLTVPKYMRPRPTKAGTAWYWVSRKADQDAGWKIRSAPLGTDFAAAVARAQELNEELDAWRRGLSTATAPAACYGTLDWMFATYQERDQKWRRLAARSKAEYRRQMTSITDMPTKRGRRVGELQASAFDGAAADRLYERLCNEDGTEATLVGARRYRQADFALAVIKTAWDRVQRIHPDAFPTGNPFSGVARVRRKRQTKIPATRAEAYALHAALIAAGHPLLALAPLICFEWLQRPEHVLAGDITWNDYRPGREAHIEHPKTFKAIDLPLADADGTLLFPELEEALAAAPRWGVPIVLAPGRRGRAESGTPKVYSRRHAYAVVAKARAAAKLPQHLTLAACRHGGFTELADADVSDSGLRALGGHASVTTSLVYAKRTEKQRARAARQRLAERLGG